MAYEYYTTTISPTFLYSRENYGIILPNVTLGDVSACMFLHCTYKYMTTWHHIQCPLLGSQDLTAHLKECFVDQNIDTYIVFSLYSCGFYV